MSGSCPYKPTHCVTCHWCFVCLSQEGESYYSASSLQEGTPMWTTLLIARFAGQTHTPNLPLCRIH